MQERFRKYIEQEKIEWVLFDYFDTIVHRTINEKDIKMIWARKMYLELIKISDFDKSNIKASDIYELRIEKEKQYMLNHPSYVESDYKGVCRGVYTSLSQYIKMSLDEFVELSLQIDILAEIGVQRIDEITVSMLYQAKKHNKKIAIISDFYLPKAAFSSFLSELGLDDLVDEIFVSTDYNARKSDGSLYKKVKEILNINKAIMIGDNEKSDVIQATENGLLAIHKKDERVKPKSKSKKAIIKEINGIYKQALKKNPFIAYSLQMYSLAERIYLECRKKQYKKIFFMAREGREIKKYFELYIMDKDIKIETEYFMVSRQSLKEVIVDEEQKIGFLEYVIRIGMHNEQPVVLVDVGWKGTSQDYLSELLPNPINGYYLGIEKRAQCSNTNQKKGLLFDANPKQELLYNIYFYRSFMQEQLLVADHGKVLGYSEEGTPIIDSDDLENQKIYLFLQDIREKQYIMFDKIKSVLEDTCFFSRDFDVDWAFKYLKMIIYVTKRKNKSLVNQIMPKKVDTRGDKLGNEVCQKSSIKEKIKEMLKKYKGVYCNSGEPIEYMKVFDMYSQQLKLRWISPYLLKLVYLLEKRYIKRRSLK